MIWCEQGVIRLMGNRRGAALVIALLVMAAASLIGIGAVTISSVEVKISGNDKFAKQTFYASDAGVEHARGILQNQFVNGNTAKIAAKQTPDWDFALLGPDPDNPTPATNTSYDGGTTWISNGRSGTSTYSVRIWNNTDAGDATNDTDRLIFAQADALGPGGSRKSIQVILEGGVTGEQSVYGYASQAGGGSGKNYNADDVNAIADFTVQVSGIQ